MEEETIYCKECKKYYKISECKKNQWWSGDPDDLGDEWLSCPKGHQVDEE